MVCNPLIRHLTSKVPRGTLSPEYDSYPLSMKVKNDSEEPSSNSLAASLPPFPGQIVSVPLWITHYYKNYLGIKDKWNLIKYKTFY
jgi:hypothetical protein